MSQFFVFNFGAAVFLIGFLVRDMVLSRAVFAVGAAVFVYGFALSDGNVFALNNFLALNWAVVFLLVNIAVIWAGLRDRFTTPLSPEGKRFKKCRNFPLVPSPNAPLQLANAGAPLQLTEQGNPSETLYYIVSGGDSGQKQ